jgi:hypothetical protein
VRDDEPKSSFESVEADAEYNELLEQQSEYIEIPTPDYDETYRNIKSLVFDGFIPVRLNLVQFPLIVKALNASEFRHIELLGASDEDRVALYFLYSMVLFDGEEVIPLRKQMHRNIIELFRTFSTQMVNKITANVNSVHRYYAAAYDNLEAFLYENEARYRWVIYGKDALNKTLLNGFSGVGFNTAQEVWISFNTREDTRELDERQFGNAKFIASAMAGDKEIRKINLKEQMRWSEELKRRQGVRLRNKESRLMLSKPVHTAKELVEELTRQIKGEKDLHDKIIEDHEREIARLAELRARDIENIKIKTAMEISESGSHMTGGSTPVTQKEMDEKTKELNNIKWTNRHEEVEHYLTKVAQTRQAGEKPDSKKSIFDPEVQDALKKLKER